MRSPNRYKVLGILSGASSIAKSHGGKVSLMEAS